MSIPPKPLPIDRDLLLQLHHDVRDALAHVQLLVGFLELRAKQEVELIRHFEGQGVYGDALAAHMAGRNLNDGVFGGGWTERTSQVQVAIARIADYLPAVEPDVEMVLAANAGAVATSAMDGRMALLRMVGAHVELLSRQQSALEQLKSIIQQQLDPRGTESAKRKARDERVLHLWQRHKQMNQWEAFARDILEPDLVLRDLGCKVTGDMARKYLPASHPEKAVTTTPRQYRERRIPQSW